MNDEEKKHNIQSCPLDRVKSVKAESYPITVCQTLSRSSQVRDRRSPALLNHINALLFSSPSVKTHRPKATYWTPSCSRGAAPWSTRQDYTWTGQLPGVCVFECVCLMCDPCTSVTIPPAAPVEETRAVPGSVSATPHIYQITFV